MNHCADFFCCRGFAVFSFLAFAAVFPSALFSQQDSVPDSLPASLVNGDLELWNDGEIPEGWFFVSNAGASIRADHAEMAAGETSAFMDASTADHGAASFTNLIQSIDAVPWRGKKVRMSAAVRTADLHGSARAQLWLRVDLKSSGGERDAVGAFDNMDDRPIRSDSWDKYEIVLEVAENADKLVGGMFLIGVGKAWLDEVTLEEVAADTESTAPSTSNRANQFQIPPAVAKALGEAEDAPQQPFYSHWLWVACLTMALFLYGMLGPLPKARGEIQPETMVTSANFVHRFAIRFACLYWVLYSGPSLVSSLAPWVGMSLSAGYEAANSWMTHWMARTFFGNPGELVPPNGSGDTTYNYLSVLGILAISVAGGLLWAVIDRRPTDDSAKRDLLRSWLRYTLAFTMLGYGLAKVSLDGMNQFPRVSAIQLDKTWGDSSPMNVVWAFMGSSRAYTIFAGLGEVVGALLIVWRRTCVLGAIVTLGVMINVMMLNFCYDVPVKLYSTHLVVMALMVIAPDLPRLVNVLMLNRPTQSVFVDGVWQRRWIWWTRWIAKAYVVGVLILLPVGVRLLELPGQWTAFSQSIQESPENPYRLTTRGFRWINEVPFNR